MGRWPTTVAFILLLNLSLASPLVRERETSPNGGAQNIDDVNIASLYNYKDDHWQMRVHKSCNDGQRQEIINSIAEAGYLANALRQWNAHGAYQLSLDKYMGAGTADGQRKTVQATIERQWDIHQHEQAEGVEVHIFCDEKIPRVKKRECENNPKMAAYTWSNEYPSSRIHQVVMCPTFFDDTKMQPLGKLLNDARSDPNKQISLWSVYRSRGSAWFHETFHWEHTVTSPKAVDEYNGKTIYSPPTVAEFAAKHGAAESIKIADSWTMAGLSNMMMQTFGLREPPSAQPVSAAESDFIAMPVLYDSVDIDDTPKIAKNDFTFVSAKMANIDPNDYASKPPPQLPSCDNDNKDCNHVSSCGNEWMPLEDWKDKKGQFFEGYKSRVKEFCTLTHGRPVAAGHRLTKYFIVGLDQGGDPADKAMNGRIEFEVNNKQKEASHEIRMTDCYAFFMLITNPDAKGSNCYGDKHDDTKGGTFQLGTDAISYHALAYKGDIAYDIDLEKIYEGTEPVLKGFWDHFEK